MVKYPTILGLSQEDINRQLYERLLKLEANVKCENSELDEVKEDIAGIKEDIGDDTTANSIKGRIKALETG